MIHYKGLRVKIESVFNLILFSNIIIYSVKIINIVQLQNVKCFRWVILRKKFCYQYLNKFVWLSLSTSTQKNSHKRILILLTLLHTISKLINITRESLRAICIESIVNIIFTKKKKRVPIKEIPLDVYKYPFLHNTLYGYVFWHVTTSAQNMFINWYWNVYIYSISNFFYS